MQKEIMEFIQKGNKAVKHMKKEIQKMVREEIREVKEKAVEDRKGSITEVRHEMEKMKKGVLKAVMQEKENTEEEKTYATAAKTRTNAHVFTVYPEENSAYADSKSVKESVKKIINPIKEKVQIKAVKQVGRSRIIIVEVGNRKELENILKNKNIEEKVTGAGLKVK